MARGLGRKPWKSSTRCYEIAQARQPISVRGVCYVLFETYGLIPDMSENSTNSAGAALRKAREMGVVPWEWIVDGSRGGHTYNYGGWDSPADYAETIASINRYRRDYWDAQPLHVEVWSEKETIAGVIHPVLQKGPWISRTSVDSTVPAMCTPKPKALPTTRSSSSLSTAAIMIRAACICLKLICQNGWLATAVT